MKQSTLFNVFLSAFVSAYSVAGTISPAGSLGTLTLDNMTQGQLLWLKGRVGEANYIFTRQDEKICSVKVPVAVGSLSEPGLGFSETTGLRIFVVSRRLNDALIEGERISSRDWRFSTKENVPNTDGLIARGISLKEGFVLNSKRKWVSWFLKEKPSVVCQ